MTMTNVTNSASNMGKISLRQRILGLVRGNKIEETENTVSVPVVVEEQSKPVSNENITYQQIAEHFGYSLGTIKCYLSPDYQNSKKAEPVRAYALSHGCITNNKGRVIRDKGVKCSYTMIADHFGITTNQVVNHLRATRKSDLSMKVKQYALENGFVKCEDGTVRSPNPGPGTVKCQSGTSTSKNKKPNQDANDYLDKSNFKNKSDRTERMTRLRKQGYTNIEIARAVGCSYPTVLKTLGRQPVNYTKVSKQACGANKTATNMIRNDRAESIKEQQIKVQEQQLTSLETQSKAILAELELARQTVSRTEELYNNTVININDVRQKLEALKAM